MIIHSSDFDKMINLINMLQWSGYLWRERGKPGEGQYLVAACPFCAAPRDSNKHENYCRIKEVLGL